MDTQEKIIQEGRAVLSMARDVFFSEHQVLQRDLSVAVLRAFRNTRINSGGYRARAFEERPPKGDQSHKSGWSCPSMERENSAGSGASRTEPVLKICDAMAAGGVRAIRYMLEAGPVQVVANDHSKKACEATLQNARLSGIDAREIPTPWGEEAGVECLRSSPQDDFCVASGLAQAGACRSAQSYCDTDAGSDGNTNAKADADSESPENPFASPERPPVSAVDQSAVSSDEPTGDTISSSSASLPLRPQPPLPSTGSFFVTLGDANAIMRSGAAVFRSSKLQTAVAMAGGREVRSAGNTETSLGWDYIDVDPFGSCLPFLEAAVAGVRDGGLLAVAATDLAMLCGKRGSQTCRRQYQASVADRPFAKEAAMRVLLHRMDILARRRGKRIVPLLCVALDFYVRLFVTLLPSEDGSGPMPPPHALSATQQPLFVAQRVDSPEFRTVLSPEGQGALGNSLDTAPNDGLVSGYDEEAASVELGRGDSAGGSIADGDRIGCLEPNTSREEETTLGPFWPGPLFLTEFVDAVLEEVKRSQKSRWKTPKIVSTLAASADVRATASPKAFVETLGSSKASRRGKECIKAGQDLSSNAEKDGGKTFQVTPLASTSSSAETPLILASRGQLVFLLDTVARELVDCPLFYSLADVAARVDARGCRAPRGDGWGQDWSSGGKVSALPREEVVWEELRSAGYECSGSHVEPRSIKTRAPLEAVEAAVSRANTKAQAHVCAAKGRGNEGRQRSRPGSLWEAWARIEREAKDKVEAGDNYKGSVIDASGDSEHDVPEAAHEGRGCGGGSGGSVNRASTSMAGDDTKAVGPRGPVGCQISRFLHASTSLAPLNWIARQSVDQSGGSPAHLTLASLEGFLENLLASNSALGEDRSSEGVSPQDGRCHHHRPRPLFNIDCGGAPSTAGARVFCVRAENGISRIYGDSGGGNADSGEVIVGAGRLAEERFSRVEDDLEQSLSTRWPEEVVLCNTIVEACASAAAERSSEQSAERGQPPPMVLVLGGKHDLGEGGIRLATKGIRVIGVEGFNGCLPSLEGRPGFHAITCAASEVSLRSLHICAGVPSPIPSRPMPAAASAPTPTTATASQATCEQVCASSEAGFRGMSRPNGREGDATPTGSAQRYASRGSGGARQISLIRKRPRLLFDRAAAQAVMASASTSARAAATASSRREPNKRRKLWGGRRPRAAHSKRGPPSHAISVEGGSAIISGCQISSMLPYACVCVSGAHTSASLVEGTRVSDGLSMGLLVCGKGEAYASGCSFAALGAAGVEARSGSRVTLTECIVSSCGRSGVFVQGFSSARLSQCDVINSSFAGVEALRNASLSMDACRVTGSSRGGVLVHGASEATLRDCDVSRSCLAGVDVRTGAEATLEASMVRDGKASGVFVSAGGSISVGSTLLRSNRLAAVEVDDKRKAVREGDAAIADGTDPLAAGVDTGCCTVRLEAGNVMVGNGLDGVMRPGTITLENSSPPSGRMMNPTPPPGSGV